MSNNNIEQVQSAQETYLATTYSGLAGSLGPAGTAGSVGTTGQAVDSIINKSVKDKEYLMQNIFEELHTSTNAYENSIFYKQRNDELAKLQEAVVARTGAEGESYDQDSQNAKRQFQINEWSANNKLDTLFISQLLFISLVFLAPLLYLKTLYIIPSGVFWGIVLLVILVFIFTVTWRVQYTDKSRNNWFWNRRRFGDYSKAPTSVCTA